MSAQPTEDWRHHRLYGKPHVIFNWKLFVIGMTIFVKGVTLSASVMFVGFALVIGAIANARWEQY